MWPVWMTELALPVWFTSLASIDQNSLQNYSADWLCHKLVPLRPEIDWAELDKYWQP